MDAGNTMFIYVGSNSNPSTIKNVFGECFAFPLLSCSHDWLRRILLIFFIFSFPKGKNSVNEIPDLCYNIPKLETPSNEALHEFIDSLNEEKPYNPTIQVIRWDLFSTVKSMIYWRLNLSFMLHRDSSPSRNLLVQYLVDDRNENSLSYYEFLQHLRTQVSK